MSGKTYRLLSEAELEYVTRAGTRTVYSWGNELGSGNANCMGCGSRWDAASTSPVGSFKPNGFGLYDVHGNVYEWTADCWNDNLKWAPADGGAWRWGDCRRRTIKSGTWDNSPFNIRSANRAGLAESVRAANVGIRVARDL